MKEKISSDTFSELYLTYYKKCFLFAKSYVHDRFVAEDIASDALLKLYEKMQNEEIEYVPSYLLTLLKNRSLDYLRKKLVRDKVHTDYLSIDEDELNFRIASLEDCDPNMIFSKEIQSIIEKTLSELSPNTRKVFEMSRFQHYRNKEIASELNMSVKNVEYHITKALDAFRKSLKDYLPLFYFLFF